MNKSKTKSINWDEVSLITSSIIGLLAGMYLSFLFMVNIIMNLSTIVGWMIIGGTLIGAIYGASNACPRPYGKSDRLPNAILWGTIWATIAGALAGLLLAGGFSSLGGGLGTALAGVALASVIFIPLAAIAGALFVLLPVLGCALGLFIVALVNVSWPRS